MVPGNSLSDTVKEPTKGCRNIRGMLKGLHFVSSPTTAHLCSVLFLFFSKPKNLNESVCACVCGGEASAGDRVLSLPRQPATVVQCSMVFGYDYTLHISVSNLRHAHLSHVAFIVSWYCVFRTICVTAVSNDG